jgi:hypothetical protein
MVLIVALENCDRRIYNIVVRYLTSCNSELRENMEPMDCIGLNVIIGDGFPVGYIRSSVHEGKYIIEMIEIFPMFRGKGYARNTVLELEKLGKEVIISHPLSFPHWISIMGIKYWKEKVNKLGSRKLYDLMTYSSNGNYDKDKDLSNFLRKLAFGSFDDKYKTWVEYGNMVKNDTTVRISVPSLDMVPYEYYVLEDGVIRCKMLYNGLSRPLNNKEIFVLDHLGIQYEYKSKDILFHDGHMYLHDYLECLSLGTRNVPNCIILEDMRTVDGSILYWDRLYKV